MSVAGKGIKRGLTAVEAGILLAEPLDKVLTMILFGLLKKQAVEVVSKDPMQIKPTETLPEVYTNMKRISSKLLRNLAGMNSELPCKTYRLN